MLNLVERFFSSLTQQPIRRGAHRGTNAFVAAIEDDIATTNESPRPVVRTQSADEVLRSLGGYRARILRKEHQGRTGGDRRRRAPEGAQRTLPEKVGRELVAAC